MRGVGEREEGKGKGGRRRGLGRERREEGRGVCTWKDWLLACSCPLLLALPPVVPVTHYWCG